MENYVSYVFQKFLKCWLFFKTWGHRYRGNIDQSGSKEKYLLTSVFCPLLNKLLLMFPMSYLTPMC